MANPFDFNASADRAVMGGQDAENAIGFPSVRPQAGLRTPQHIMAESQRQLAAAQQAAAPPALSGPIVGFNPATKEVFSGGKIIAPGYDGYKAANAAGLFNIPNQQLPEGFLPMAASRVHAKEMKAVQQTRPAWAVANDAMIEGANAFVGGAKSISDMIAPGGNAFSTFIDEEIIQPGIRDQSDPTKYQKDLLAQGFNSSDTGTQASAVGTYLANRPGAALMQGAGSLVGLGAVTKGVRGVGALAGLGEKGVARAGLGAGMLTSGAMGGGDAAQSAYDQVMQAPELANVPIEQRQEMALAAARKASIVPFGIGAVSGALGAEGAVARGLGNQAGKGVLRTAGVEGASEFFEEGATALSGNLAAQQYAPSIDAGRGVFGQALMGGALGTAMGAGVGFVGRGPTNLLQPGAPTTPPPAPVTPPAIQPTTYPTTGPMTPLSGERDMFGGVVPAAPAPAAGPSSLFTEQDPYTTPMFDAQGAPTYAADPSFNTVQETVLDAQQGYDAAQQAYMPNRTPLEVRTDNSALADQAAQRAAQLQAEYEISQGRAPAPATLQPSPSEGSATAVAPSVSPQAVEAPAESFSPAETPATPAAPIVFGKDDEPLQAKVSAITSGKVAARSTGRVLDKPERLALVRALNGKISDAVNVVLGAKTVSTIKRIHALSMERLAMLDQLAAGKKLVMKKDGSYGSTKAGGRKDASGNRRPVDLRDLKQDDAEENLDTAYAAVLEELSDNAAELGKLFGELEADVGRRAVNAAQKVSKNTAAGGVQAKLPMALSRAYRDYTAGEMTAKNPVPGPKVGVTRERTELGVMTGTKWASVFHKFGFGSNTYTGTRAVLQKIRMHSGNPLLASIASRLIAMETDDNFAAPNMVFYTEAGRQVVDAKGNLTIDESDKFSDLPGYSDKTRAMYMAGSNTIHVGPDGQGADTILHELIHAYLIGYVRSNPKSEEVAALNALRLHVIAQLKKNSDEKAQKLVQLLSSETQGLDEFLAYGLTEQALQDFMMDMPGVKGQSYFKDAWNAFSALIRKILGMPADSQKALAQFLLASGDLLEKGYAMKVGTAETVEATSVAKTGYDKVADFWTALAKGPARNLFQTPRMDNSYGKPDRSFTMDEVLAHHLQGNWKIEPAKVLGANNPDGSKVVAGWKITNQNEDQAGEFGIWENDKGEVTVQSPGNTPGKGQGSKVLQAALAYSFYNGKVFVGELEGMGMSDSAVTRYTEAMVSAALKYGSTDFMRPNSRQMDPSTRGPEDEGNDTFTDDAAAYKWSLKGWKVAGSKGSMEARFLGNLNLMSKMLSSMALAENNDLRSYSFYMDEGFLDKDGKKATNLTSTQKRAIIVESIASMGSESAMRQRAAAQLTEDDDSTEIGTENLFYATGLTPNTANGVVVTPQGTVDLPVLINSKPTKAYLEGVFKALVPTLFEEDGALRKKIADWAEGARKGIETHSPTTAAFLNKVNANFSVSGEMADFVESFKTHRQSPVTSANELVKLINRSTPAQVIEMFDYMDALTTDPKNATNNSNLLPHVKAKVKDAHAALMKTYASITDNDLKDAFAGLKPSEMLVHALRATDIQGQTLGAREGKALNGRAVSVTGNSQLRAPSIGGVMMSSGRWYPVMVNGVLDHMVNEAASPAEVAKADKTRTYRKTKYEASTDTHTFRELTTVKSLLSDPSLKDKATETIGTSFLNSVSIMANAVAARRLMADINAVGVRENLVFKDAAALAKFLGRTGPEAVNIGKLSDSESDSAPMKWAHRKPGNWVQVPTSAAYGDLAGKVVSAPVWTRMSDAVVRNGMTENQYLNGAVRIFKKVKTQYNPATAITNVMGNFTLAYMNNLNTDTVKKAMWTYVRYMVTPGRLSTEELRLMSAFHASGATLGDFSTNEVKQLMYEAMAEATEVGDKGVISQLAAWTNYENSLREKIIKFAAKNGQRADEISADAYATGDNMFRLAAFMSEVGRLQQDEPHLSPEEIRTKAGVYAKKAFLDYDNDSRLMHWLRAGPLPFVSWTYAYSGVLYNIAKNQPWKTAELALMYSLVTAAFAAAEGDDRDEKRKRAKMDDKTWFGADKQVKLWTNAKGQDIYFDAGKWFMPTPLSFSDNPNGFLGFHSWPSALTPNNPILTSTMYMFGYDPYTGKRVYKDTNTPLQNALVAAGKIGTTFTPPWMSDRAFGAKPGLLGHEPNQAAHYTRLFIAPVKSIDDAEAQRGVSLEIKRVMSAFDKEKTAQARAAATGKITKEEAAEAIRGIMERRKEEIEKLKESK